MFQPLSVSLQASVRFFFHPLPSRELCLRYLRLTGSIRPLPDSVGFTLLCLLVFFSLFSCCLSCDGYYVHTIYEALNHRFNPHTFWLEPISLIWLFMEWRSLSDSSLTFTIRVFPLAPDQLRLLASATFVVCTPPQSLLRGRPKTTPHFRCRIPQSFLC